MAIPAYIDNDRAGQRGQARAQPLTDLSAGINAMQRAAFALEQLGSNHLYDIELVDSRDGRDIASFLDDSIRYGRAAYAVVHMGGFGDQCRIVLHHRPARAVRHWRGWRSDCGDAVFSGVDVCVVGFVVVVRVV